MDKKRSFKELCDNKEFLQKVLVQKNENDVKKLFAENGVKISQQELNEIREVINLTLGKKQKLTPSEIKEVSGGMRTAAIVQLSNAVSEALLLLIGSQISDKDPTGATEAIALLEEDPEDPYNLSWGRVAANAINGTLDLDPRLKSAASKITAWWNS